MSHLSFYDDSYERRLTARVMAIEQGHRVLLTRTVFFPRTSTEPGDHGWIGGHRVVDVVKEDQQVWHSLEPEPAPELAVDDVVVIELDWARRYLIMRTHSALHLLGSVIEAELGHRAVAGVVEERSGYLVLRSDLGEDEVERAVSVAREEIRRGLEIRAYWDAEREGFRWCEYGTYPRMPDGGLHVRSTSEIGDIELLSRARRKGKLRLSFCVNAPGSGSHLRPTAGQSNEPASRVSRPVPAAASDAP